MIAGLPLQSWLLIAAAVGVGLIIELAFLRAHRRGSTSGTAPDDARTGQPLEERGP